jgi:hypothetical protein
VSDIVISVEAAADATIVALVGPHDWRSGERLLDILDHSAGRTGTVLVDVSAASALDPDLVGVLRGWPRTSEAARHVAYGVIDEGCFPCVGDQLAQAHVAVHIPVFISRDEAIACARRRMRDSAAPNGC